MQEDTRRPWATKQRIMSRHGHLSNRDTADAIETLANGKLENVVLCHLSGDCNTPEIARRSITEKLNKSGIYNIKITVSNQGEPTETIVL